MNEILTTKDLTKNELSLAKLLVAGIILAGLIIFLNSAQMDQKEIPEIALNPAPTQAIDGSGLVNFGASISQFSLYDLKLKIEYSLDGETYLPLILSQALIDSGSIVFNPADEFQVSNIVTESENVNLSFVWDTKADSDLNQISNSNTKIKITALYKLKEVSGDSGSLLNNSSEPPAQENPPDNSQVEIIDDEATVDNEVIIEPSQGEASQPETNPIISESITPEVSPVQESPDIVNTVTAAFVEAIENEIDSAPIIDENFEDSNPQNNEEIWLEMPIISENFKLDNAGPRIRSGQVNLDSYQIYLYFNELVSLRGEISNQMLKLQNEILSESTLEWLNEFTLVVTLSAAEKEKYTAPINEWVLEFNPGESIYDLFGNKFDGGLVFLTEQKESVIEEEIKEEDKEDEEEKKDDEVIIPENITQTIKTRGLNQNCSFNPDDFVMSAGETRETILSLTPRDPDSKFIISSTSVPEGFEVKILQSSGTGNQPVTVSISVPAEAAPRLYKILLRYEDFTPQSVSYVNNCVLRLTVE